MRYIRLIFAVLFAVSLASCQPHRPGVDTYAPGGMMPKAYSGGGGSDGEGELSSPLSGRWWEAFGEPELDRLIEEAFSNNHDLSAAIEGLAQLHAITKQAGASGGPSLELGASAGRARQRYLTDPVTSGVYGLSLSAGYELDLFGRIGSLRNAARFDELATAEEIKALYISLSAEVAELYFLALQKKAVLDIAEKTAASFNESLLATELRYAGGLAESADIYKIKKALASAQAQLTAAGASLKNTLHALSVLVGRYPDQEILGANAGGLPELPAQPEAGLPSELLKQRPDLEAALLRVRAADERAAAAVADRFPSFNLMGSVQGASGELRTVLDSPNILWNALLSAAMPLIDAGRRKAEAERSEAALREALVRYHRSVLRAFQDVEDALVTNASAVTRLMETQNSLSAASSSYRLTKRQYGEGLAEYPALLASQRELYESEGLLVSAKREALSARIGLARALGGGTGVAGTTGVAGATGFAKDELDRRLSSIPTERNSSDEP